jgi:hypothetical protein
METVSAVSPEWPYALFVQLEASQTNPFATYGPVAGLMGIVLVIAGVLLVKTSPLNEKLPKLTAGIFCVAFGLGMALYGISWLG